MGGAGSMIGGNRVANAAPNGCTFLHGNRWTHIYSQILSKKPMYDAVAEFAPVRGVRRELRRPARAQGFPRRRRSANSARSSAPTAARCSSLGGRRLGLACGLRPAQRAIGVEVTHIPYRGTAPALQDLIGGRVDYLCDIISTAIPPIQAGLVKPLAILSLRRNAALPDLATADEQGLKDFDVDAWNAFFFPKGTPDAIVRRLAKATSEVVEIPAGREAAAGDRPPGRGAGAPQSGVCREAGEDRARDLARAAAGERRGAVAGLDGQILRGLSVTALRLASPFSK